MLLFPAEEQERSLQFIQETGARRIGLTGGSAPELALRLRTRSGLADGVLRQVTEFEAWGRGASLLLREQGHEAEEPYLLISLGTGCSAMRVCGGSVTRVGGTALGGGTVIGLGSLLAGTANFKELTHLAARGDRRNVDLLVGDIAGGINIPLPGDLNAASFAKLGRPHAKRPSASDLSHAIMGMVGENVGLICSGLAQKVGVERIVFGGSTLRDNQSIIDILRLITLGSGCEAVILENGEFTGARGALEFVSQEPGEL